MHVLSQANLSFYCLSVCIHVGESVICHETIKGTKKGEMQPNVLHAKCFFFQDTVSL